MRLLPLLGYAFIALNFELDHARVAAVAVVRPVGLL